MQINNYDAFFKERIMIKKKSTPANIRKIDELNTAIVCNDFNAIHEILITNLDVNVPDSHGVFPVMYAVQYGNANALISLIRHGANINVIDKRNGYSLLMKALTDKYIPNRYLIIVLLLKNGTDVNIISRTSKTALYLAKLYHPKYIDLLKRYGAEY